MIVAFSSSSPIASVALISSAGGVLACRAKMAPKAASSACIALLHECLEMSSRSLEDVRLFAADIGPGSFTGTRVGVMMAKAFAYVRGCDCIGATSFDLINPEKPAFVPSKKGEWLLRKPSREPVRVSVEPAEEAVGYPREGLLPHYPNAAGFACLLDRMSTVRPEELMPFYFHEPSISKPNKPYRLEGLFD